MIPIKKITPRALKSFASRLKNTPLFSRLLGKLSILGSQAGQDFWVYSEAFNQKRHGYFLDIGAHDGINMSNTYTLESHYEWTGLCVEANPKTFSKLIRNRTAMCANLCLDESEGIVNFALRDGRGGIVEQYPTNSSNANERCPIVELRTISLVTLLEKYNAPTTIDYLSIDVEGAEERILGNFDFDTYVFKTMTIERPSKKLRSTLDENGYLLVKEIPNLDCFFIHKSYKREYKKNLFKFYAQKKIAINWK